MTARNKLHTQFPWTRSPLITNAPMSGFAGVDLAVAVSRAGGLGQIGFDYHAAVGTQLQQAKELLKDIDTSSIDSDITPVGVGIIVFGAELAAWSQILGRYKPAMVWLFAANITSDYAAWTQEIRSVSPHTKVWVQLGSVGLGMRVAWECQPDCLVMQGSDAGGHGHERGASIISLVPEMHDSLREAGLSNDIALVAAGGIADARAVMAALMLGADGVVMGTRFLAATETLIDEENRALVLAAKDGGQSTVRTKFFDELFGENRWPEIYDGRGLVNKGFLDQKSGQSLTKIRKSYWAAMLAGDESWNVVWAGSGVGMFRKAEPAGGIMEQIFKDVAKLTKDTQTLFATVGNTDRRMSAKVSGKRKRSTYTETARTMSL